MTNALDGLRAKVQFVLMRIEKAKEREVTARRLTNKALVRSKAAVKKAFYLRHKLHALKDTMFIHRIKLERTMMSLAITTKSCYGNPSKRCEQDEALRVNKLEHDISSLEIAEWEFLSDTAILSAKRDAMVQKLDDVERRFFSTDEDRKILENRLLRLNETLRLKKMKRDLDDQKRGCKTQVLTQLRRYLDMANARYSRAMDRKDPLTKKTKQIARKLNIQINAMHNTKQDVDEHESET